MPVDKTGRFHLNIQRAHAADRMAAPKPKATDEVQGLAPAHGDAGDGSAETTLHDHGDGTFHTASHDGERAEHPSIGHALMHIAAKHADGKHMHIHHDGVSHTSHHVDESGQVAGPHEHDSADAVAEHARSFFADGQQPQAAEDNDDSEDDRSLSGLSA